MEIINALEAKNQFGQLLDLAQSHPVQITKHGRAVAIVISIAEYEKLKKSQETTLKDAILSANQEEAEDLDYQEELAAWDNTLNDGLINDKSNS